MRDLTGLVLLHGKHAFREDGMCALEAVAWLAGREHTDRPPCVSTIIAAFVRQWNDHLKHADRQMLIPLLPKMIGTANPAKEEARRFMLIDWLIRVCTPAWLRLAELTKQAKSLESLPPLINDESLISAKLMLSIVSSDCYNVSYVARIHGGSAGYAASTATKSAGCDAASYATRYAGSDTANYATINAATHAAYSSNALLPTVKELQASALKLIERMCAT